MVQELNKIAIVHLYLLGFEDELGNFTLGLTNPSAQAELLKGGTMAHRKYNFIGMLLVTQVMVYLPVSSSWAKKHILGFSDDEIKLDITTTENGKSSCR